MAALANPRHERFAQELAKGKPACEAYVLAGYKESRPAASRLSTNVNISLRIAELQERGAIKVEITAEMLVAELEEARQLAMETKQASAMATATIGKARLLGLIIEKKEDVTPRRSLSELDTRIRSLTKREREGGADRAPGRAGTEITRDAAIPNVPGTGTA